MPGTDPLCKQRIVSPIPIKLRPRSSGTLLVRIDPRGFFTNVDFSVLTQEQEHPPLYRIQDSPADAASNDFLLGIHASAGVYAFEWTER